MDASSKPDGAGRAAAWSGALVCTVLLLAVYGAGLTHEMARPWTGMHDWNGAFFSQLGRNFLRYPNSIHSGLPVVAVGQAVPPPEERSIYSTHPPGLVWLVALAFRATGEETEWAARLVPVIFSLGALVLLVRIVGRAWGRDAAAWAGVIYAVMPMAVYFGRMVNHEAVCLGLMLAAAAAWQQGTDPSAGSGCRRAAWVAWAVAVSSAIWVDWSGLLFGGLFALYAILEWVRGRLRRPVLILALGIPVIAGGGMLIYLVYAGLAGRWADLLAIFLSRATDVQGGALSRDAAATGETWNYTVENLSWPVLALSGIGLALTARRWWRRKPWRGPTTRDGSALLGTGGFWLVLATGIVWLFVFWRQYERHNYWSFYLGPAAAVLAARALMALRDLLHRHHVSWANMATIALTAIVIGLSVRATADYFARLSYPPSEVVAWKQVHERTGPGDRVLLFRNPVRTERRGQYVFRNLVPPQLAYYLDRSFAVERDLDAVVEDPSPYAAYVISMEDAEAYAAWLSPLSSRYAAVPLAGKWFFGLRGEADARPRAAGGAGQ